MASNVPKFASFRPKPKAAPVPPVDPEPRERPASKSKTSRSDRSTKSIRTTDVLEAKADAGSSKLYFSDRRGDADVLRYGTLNRSDIPSYRRAGYGYVLGLSLDQKIDRERSAHGKIYFTPATRPRQERLLTAKHAPKDGTRMLHIVKQEVERDVQTQKDYIPVSGGRKRKRDSSVDSDELTPDLDYRGIARDPHEPLDPDTQYDSGVEHSSFVAESTRKNSELVRLMRESPQDVQVWLNFIEHQEAMLGVDRSELNENLRQRLADVRIPMYEEALKEVPIGEHTRLYQGFFREARRSWNTVKLATKFEQVLVKHPASAELWLMYLDFVQSSFTGFKYETCRETFSRCLQSFRAASKDADVETTLHIIIRLTTMMQGAGYQELALAVWQAILEFHVMDSTLDESDIAQSLPAFEQFWEAEAPRIGEAGGQGWRKPTSGDHVPNTTTLRPHDTSVSAFEDFKVREPEAVVRLQYPGRTTDEVGEDDAFHTIFFTDVEEYLKSVPRSTPKTCLVEAFLCFCGLPPLPRVAEHQRIWWNDPFLSRISAQPSAVNTTSSQADLLADRVIRYSACDIKNIQMDVDALFEHSLSLQGVRLEADFVRRVLRLVATEYANEEIFGEYLLAFESRHCPSEVVKSAKQLLKARPTSQRLYHAYGLVELHRGKLEKADQVFSMALSMGSLGSYESMMLIHSWVWAALDTRDDMRTLWRLVSHTGKIPTNQDISSRPGDDRLQSARVAISNVCENALLRQDYATAVLGTSLLAILAYLTSLKDAEAALAVHRGLLQYFTSHNLSASPFSELAAQSTARFLAYHASTAKIVKPAVIRSSIEPLLFIFPNNTMLLSLYAANEARFAIDDRVRGIMSNALQSSERRTVAGWSFAIHFETVRGEIAGSTEHSKRALYQRATSSDSSGAHSPALWRSYLCFELKQYQREQARVTNKRPRKDGSRRTWESRLVEAESRVKQCFYAGLRNLPWCKDFIMLAFTEMEGVFNEDEMWKVYRVMQEKELRVYVDLD